MSLHFSWSHGCQEPTAVTGESLSAPTTQSPPPRPLRIMQSYDSSNWPLVPSSFFKLKKKKKKNLSWSSLCLGVAGDSWKLKEHTGKGVCGRVHDSTRSNIYCSNSVAAPGTRTLCSWAQIHIQDVCNFHDHMGEKDVLSRRVGVDHQAKKHYDMYFRFSAVASMFPFCFDHAVRPHAR